MLNRIIPLALCVTLATASDSYACDEQTDESRKRTRTDISIEAYEALLADNEELRQRIRGMELTEEDHLQTIRITTLVKDGLYEQIAALQEQNRRLLAGVERHQVTTDDGATPTKAPRLKLQRRNAVLDLGDFIRRNLDRQNDLRE